ncbi:150R [Yaba monkey tumor virus]|uniref:150R n=1 Tax=Yaba monkey tumor virus (strain VR587) TaxID=928314 RepID=Q6TUM4_YMTV5|nr:putative transmembrane protein [Yaba monkey tumor virus]AAR07502.1 150R [Yaba monkey tumor virus]
MKMFSFIINIIYGSFYHITSSITKIFIYIISRLILFMLQMVNPYSSYSFISYLNPFKKQEEYFYFNPIRFINKMNPFYKEEEKSTGIVNWLWRTKKTENKSWWKLF